MQKEIKDIPVPGIEPGPPGWEPGILATRPHGIFVCKCASVMIYSLLQVSRTSQQESLGYDWPVLFFFVFFFFVNFWNAALFQNLFNMPRHTRWISAASRDWNTIKHCHMLVTSPAVNEQKTMINHLAHHSKLSFTYSQVPISSRAPQARCSFFILHHHQAKRWVRLKKKRKKHNIFKIWSMMFGVLDCTDISQQRP